MISLQEAGVEKELVNLLCKLSAQHYLPILAHHRVTTEALRHMSSSDLKKVRLSGLFDFYFVLFFQIFILIICHINWMPFDWPSSSFCTSICIWTSISNNQSPGNETENLFISLHHLVITSALLNIKDEIVTRDRAQPGSWSSSVLDRFLLLTDRTKLYIWCCYLHKSGKIRNTGRCCFDGLYSVKVNGVLIYLRHWVADIAICRFLYSNWIMLH